MGEEASDAGQRMEVKHVDLIRRLAPGLAVAASLVVFRLAASPEAVSDCPLR